MDTLSDACTSPLRYRDKNIAFSVAAELGPFLFAVTVSFEIGFLFNRASMRLVFWFSHFMADNF